MIPHLWLIYLFTFNMTLDNNSHSIDSYNDRVVFDAIKKEYKQMASWYDCFWHSYTRATLKAPLDLVSDELAPGGTLVDVACGTGEFLNLFYEKSNLGDSMKYKLIGIEPSQEMMEQARKKLESKRSNCDIELKVSPAEYLPLSDSCADCVVSTNAFHFFRHKEQALKEMKRILKTDGKVIITDWCNDYFVVKLYHFMERLRWNWRFKDRYPGPLTKDELYGLIQSAGFESIVISSYRVRVFLICLWGMQTITAIKKSDDTNL